MQKDEIKEIYLSNLEWTKTHDNMGGVMGNVIFKNSMSLKEFEKIVENTYVILCDKDYITNLQDTLQDIEEYIGHLEELCNKYEEEHSTTFNEWKETITDKYQTLKNLQEENESLQKRNKEIYDGFIATQKELSDYATKNEKANWWLKEMLKQAKSDETKAIINGTLELLLNGGDEE